MFPIGDAQEPQLQRCSSLSPAQKKRIMQRSYPRADFQKLRNEGRRSSLEADGWTVSNLNAIVLQDHELWCAAVREALAFRIYERNTREGCVKLRSVSGEPFLAMVSTGAIACDGFCPS